MKPKFVKKFLRVQGGNIFSAVTSLQIQVRLGGMRCIKNEEKYKSLIERGFAPKSVRNLFFALLGIIHPCGGTCRSSNAVFF